MQEVRGSLDVIGPRDAIKSRLAHVTSSIKTTTAHMELYDIGKHCNLKGCNQLDFLPFKCDGCNKVFCSEHWKSEIHSCSVAILHDRQVPSCPICQQPVPYRLGENPNVMMNKHIQNNCAPVSAHGKAYTNQCHVEGCKKRELIPFKCEQCRHNYCVRHRHVQDHKCEPARASRSATGTSKSLLETVSGWIPIKMRA